MTTLTRALLMCSLGGALNASAALAQGYPTPRAGDWTARAFQFHTGEVAPELRLHYTTVGEPSGRPVLILHGTARSGGDFLTPEFAGRLFGPGQPLDATRHFIILPDAIGTGGSAKPSDGLRMRFPRYNYEDMVRAQHRLVTEHFGIRRLHLVLGNSMGGMHTWLWGVLYPDLMDALVPLASLPTEMSGRNWMLRRMIVETIRADPAWNDGNYTAQPPSLRIAQVFYGLATSGGTRGLQAQAPTRAAADRIVDARMAAGVRGDANDLLYQWDASRDYNPAPHLERIRAAVLAINSADDERNPAELGVLEREMPRVPHGRFVLVPASDETRGHGTVGDAKWWVRDLASLLQELPSTAP